MRTPALLVAAVSSAILTIACVAEAPTKPGEDLRAFLAEDWTYWMNAAPEAATAFGVAGHDAAWSDYSPAAIAARQASSHCRPKDVCALPHGGGQI